MGTSYLIAKVLRFWAAVYIFSKKEVYLKEMDTAESAVEFLAGDECELAE